MKNNKQPLPPVKKIVKVEGKVAKKDAGKVLTGVMDTRNENFAFFIPDDKTQEDFFVHKNNFNGAVHSDKVLVRTGVFRGRKEAVVEKIIERGVKELIGVVDMDKGSCRVIPFSRHFNHDILIKECDGLKDGDVVTCVIDKYPEGRFLAKGSILKRVCHVSDTNADNITVIHKYSLNREFPEPVSALADKIKSGEERGYENKKGEKDFRSLFTVTIDGETARDFDDAISVEETEKGFHLYVHIADVSRFVLRGSAIDNEAKARGTSVYFPQFAIPMLPEVLSNDKCSLLPDTDRFTVTAKISLDKNGAVIGAEFYRSIIKSDFRLTYSYVNKVLKGTEDAYSSELADFLKRSETLALLMTERRADKGYIDFESPEPQFIFDKDGNVEDIVASERGFSERMIELFMVCANEAAAKFLSDNHVDAVYRIHGEPDMKKIEGWIEAAKMFGVALPEVSLPVTNDDIGKLARVAADSKYSDILSSMLIRTMMRAEYSTDNMGHFGLSSTAYTHFTSPIRRYPDLIVHRALLDKLESGPRHESLEELKELAPELSRLERLAEDAEYEISTLKKIEFMQSRPDEVYDAYINRITPSGIFIYVAKVMMTGFVDFISIDFDTFYTDDFSATGRRTGERYKVGDKIRVSLYSASIFMLQANFSLERTKQG